ncbi:helix-turn-helix transcriptional regulator [Mesobacterium sp. TK19101]|uniref:Helix-turn-helix transcriptional regulator n=1 Tax=Mesobacterium hydrothermale TaxID=3111907 RepID=A0ABU6HJ06_9RHOB|nr:helix-turn-helix transcriptional regulator [Mesobacterium sp. TK19101]MEC3861891.1 helix-turn-helix transcriptional regulator [Mesobacterium sp. TK19101]
MLNKIDKRRRAHLFRSRLLRAMEQTGTSQSALARRTGVDRSTISQLTTDDGARLPNAHIAASCASALGVSADWLLGLSERPESAADLLSTSLSLTAAPRALVDEQIFGWHQEAAGYKIRHVPAGLPDMLKTRAILEWEYAPHLGRTTEQAINASQDRLDWMRNSASDYEIAFPLHELHSFASGEGYYNGLSPGLRRSQLDHLRSLTEQLYPRLRLYLFDARRVYSAPVTIFGPRLAVIYLGRNYVSFRDTERVQAITTHFDHLVREATVGARSTTAHLSELTALAQ